ncbi:hypothetical protein EHQ58_10330 [Leptospira ognonensis]|uniref:Uncharacterized protein n=1 Tax=Leptospira ognonensis TaxID=2484945 RepID=A0A4R9JZ13_9LEPT|nr:hypothetical protein [Leptospira ognonensis]TGL58529.1 hypothetical protein EHQ58_10330 [Leptospira ognonensis]
MGVKITYYDYYASMTNFAAGLAAGLSFTGSSSTIYGVATRCSNDGIKSSQTVSLSTASPRIRFKNSSGSTETYSLHTSITCGASTKYASIGSVANGGTSSYFTISARTASSSISYNDGANCTNVSYFFSNGNVWTITSGTSTYSIAATTE